MLQTEFEFTLPLGYVDKEGVLHREGIMRLAAAADEILPLKDPRVQGNKAYLVIILLSRVIIKLGPLTKINTKVVEELFAADMAYLQEFYNQINRSGKSNIEASCPKCSHRFEVDLNSEGS
jgi:hypothetical protein